VIRSDETSSMLRRTFRIATLLCPVAGLLLAGCSSDANPVRDLAVSAGVTGGEPKPAPDFVTRTRTDQVEYLPVGVAAPRRARPRKAEDVAKAETEMSRVRQRNEARGSAARKAAGPAPAAAGAPAQ
jgi:hypothetical protein